MRRPMRPIRPQILLALLLALALALAGCTTDEEEDQDTDEEAGDDDGGSIYTQASDPKPLYPDKKPRLLLTPTS